MGHTAVFSYKGGSPYSLMRDKAGNPHDFSLCAYVVSSAMKPGERLIIRNELIGYDIGYLYDDHIPVYNPDGRGNDYQHISHKWDTEVPGTALKAECVCNGGGFSVDLVSSEDFIDISLSIRNGTDKEFEFIDWHFCIVGYEAASLADHKLDRTFVSAGGELAALRSIIGDTLTTPVLVKGGYEKLTPAFKGFGEADKKADRSVIIVEACDSSYSAALVFQKSYILFCGPWNSCFHADPYFGTIPAGGKKIIKGRLYLKKMNASELYKELLGKNII